MKACFEECRAEVLEKQLANLTLKKEVLEARCARLELELLREQELHARLKYTLSEVDT